jgi:hypothetical protein
MNKRLVGMFIKTNGKKIATVIDYRSKTNFQNLIKKYSDAEFFIPSTGDKLTFVSSKEILNDAYENLKITKAYSTIINLLAQNSDIY